LASLSGVESYFAGGELQIIKSSDLYCSSGEISSRDENSGESSIDTLFISPAILETSGGVTPSYNKGLDVEFKHCSAALVLTDEENISSFILEQLKPSRAPPKA